MKNILIVDSDLGFVCWLGQVLFGADYQPWPACSVADAIAVVGRKPGIPLDLLIVNPSLPGISHLITLYRRSQAHLKVIAVGPQDERILPGVKAWHEKPGPRDKSAKQEWVREIERIFGGSHAPRVAANTSIQLVKKLGKSAIQSCERRRSGRRPQGAVPGKGQGDAGQRAPVTEAARR